MGAIADRLAVQSYCFREFKDNAKVADLVRECGLTGIELCSVHVDPFKPETFPSVVETYRKAGVQVVSIGVFGLGGKVSTRDVCELAKATGTKHVGVSFVLGSTPGSFRQAEELAAEYDLRMSIHNHGGKHWLGSLEMLQYVMTVTNDRIGVLLDTAWAMHSHLDPIVMAQKLSSRVYGVHIKDFVFDRSGNHQDVVVGTGNLDLPKLAATLKEIGFTGPAVLEYEGDASNPVPALKECVAAVRRAM